jgi:hypothetical protein
MTEPINREQRRAAERGDEFDKPRAQGDEGKLAEDAAEQYVRDQPGKSSPRRKVTADKWNQ